MTLAAQRSPYGIVEPSRGMRAPQQQDGEFVWQWLLLLLDGSGSMRSRFERMSYYDMQVEALARALMEPCVVDRLLGSPVTRTAMGAVLWSANRQQRVVVHWRILRSIEDVAAVAAGLRSGTNFYGSYTGTAAAVRFAMKQMTAACIPRECRRIINMTGNGRDNHGGDPAAMARSAEKWGVTINAVVMRGEDGTVDQIYDYYNRSVITGDGLVFKVKSEAAALEALAVANASKFCAEIALAPSAACLPA